MQPVTGEPKSPPEGYHSVTPYLIVEGVPRLIDFLKSTFGAEERTRFSDKEGRVEHAEMKIGDTVVMMADGSTVGFNPVATQLYVYVDNVDVVYDRALDGGGASIREPKDQSYGDRTASFKDPTGNIWWIAMRIDSVL